MKKKDLSDRGTGAWGRGSPHIGAPRRWVSLRRRPLLPFIRTFGNTRDYFLIFALSCLFYLEQIKNETPKCNHFTIKKTEKNPPNHVYTLPEAVPGGEAGFEELFGLVDRS